MATIKFLDDMIASKMPSYKKIRISPKFRTGTLVPVDHIIYKTIIDNTSFFLHFITLPDEDRLQLEVGWSESNIFPSQLSRMTVFEFSKSSLNKEDFILDFELCYHLQMKTNPEPWYLWKCSQSIPEINWSRKDDLDHVKEFEDQSKKFRDAYIEEAIRIVSEEEAMTNTKIALINLVSDIEKYVFPIFDSKLFFQKTGLDNR